MLTLSSVLTGVLSLTKTPVLMLSYLAVAKQELGGPIWYPKFIKVGYMF